jgi:phosphate:Na+ symporter
MVRRIAKLLRRIRTISTAENPEEISENLRKSRRLLAKNEILASGKLDKLIRRHLITNEMATSLINDSAYVRTLIQNLIAAAEILYVKPRKKFDEKKSDGNESQERDKEAELTTPESTPNTASS